MSRLGKLPIKLPAGVQATIKDQEIVLKGPKGELKLTLHPVIEAKIENNEILIAPKSANKIKNADALWGLFWS